LHASLKDARILARDGLLRDGRQRRDHHHQLLPGHVDDGLVRRPGFRQHGRPWHGDAKREPFAGVDSNSIG
jgi:hypothetical protein